MEEEVQENFWDHIVDCVGLIRPIQQKRDLIIRLLRTLRDNPTGTEVNDSLVAAQLDFEKMIADYRESIAVLELLEPIQ